ncbi:integrase core domain-containing protein [Brucella anthropi]|uniref:integrase core domain-containing protein n=1 Tax=Brucella anthropi TaxID=529 RepID=UPI00215722E1|nr:integrase core domain-containing protein [Brucella anthropi]
MVPARSSRHGISCSQHLSRTQAEIPLILAVQISRASSKLRILTIVDTHSRYSPATDPRFSYRGEDVVQTLEKVCRRAGYPKTIRVDNGSEFISRDLDPWAYANKVTLDFSRPGKPTDNGFIEAFNSKLRAECLNAHWFLTLEDAREKLENWRRHYNEDRPHSAIGYNVPIALHNPDGVISPPLA